jgi:LacI family transcriptional regulator, gluconate utilization system Gnt-I transcriptional repressor
MADVARRASVAKITVSRYLREPGTVATKTGQRIHKAIEAVGYIPNFVAGGLSSNRTRIIAAVMPTINNPMLARTLDSISNVLSANGYSLMLANCGGTLVDEELAIKALVAQRPAGLILHAVKHSDETVLLLRNLRIPTVETGDLLSKPALDLAVGYSNYEAARAMTQHLIARDYKKIGFVSIPYERGNQVGERIRGYRAALRAAKRNFNEDYVSTAPQTFSGGAKAIANLLDCRPEIDAVFFAGDILAAGALFECHRRCWPVPGRIAIAGFDNYDVASQTVPALSTIEVPRAEIGRLSAEMLLKRLKGEPLDCIRVDVGFRIVERAST